jgi:hypothetical protein
MRCLTALMVTVSLLVFGCNAVSDMKGMFEKQELVQRAIKEKYNLQSQVGWKINNGILTHVTIVFAADEVRDRKVSDLIGIAREAVASSFKSTPQVLNVQITAKGADST